MTRSHFPKSRMARLRAAVASVALLLVWVGPDEADAFGPAIGAPTTLGSLRTDDVPRIGTQSLADWRAEWREASIESRRGMIVRASMLGPTHPNPEAMAELRNLVTSEDAVSREMACALLGSDQDGGESSRSLLQAALQDPEPWVRYWAADSLYHSAWNARVRGVELRSGVEELVRLSENQDLVLRRAVVESLSFLAAAEPQLVENFGNHLRDADAQVRRHAAAGLSLGLLAADSSRKAKTFLFQALSDSDDLVRLTAAQALSSEEVQGQDRVLSVLLELASVPDRAIRQAAIVSLGSLDAGYAAELRPVLLGLLDDPMVEIRTCAAGALGNLCMTGDVSAPETVPRLLELVKDPDPAQRGAAAWALANVGAEAAVAFPVLAELVREPDEDARRRTTMAWDKLVSEVVAAPPTLIPLLDHPAESVRLVAAKQLAESGADASSAAPLLVQRMQDPSASVRAWSLYALRQIGAASLQDLGPLLDTLKNDPAASVRLEVIRTLAAFGPEARDAANAVVGAVGDADHDVRRWAIWALGEIGVESEAVLGALAVASSDSDGEIRADALSALEKLGAAERVEALRPSPIQVDIPYGEWAVLVSGPAGVLLVSIDRVDAETRAGRFVSRFLDRASEQVTEGEGAFGDEPVATLGEGNLRFDWSFTEAGLGVASWQPEHLWLCVVGRASFATTDLRRFLR